MFSIIIYWQKSASIQPRTSPVKFARSPCTDPPGTSTSACPARREPSARSARTRASSASRAHSRGLARHRAQSARQCPKFGLTLSYDGFSDPTV